MILQNDLVSGCVYFDPNPWRKHKHLLTSSGTCTRRSADSTADWRTPPTGAWGETAGQASPRPGQFLKGPTVISHPDKGAKVPRLAGLRWRITEDILWKRCSGQHQGPGRHSEMSPLLLPLAPDLTGMVTSLCFSSPPASCSSSRPSSPGRAFPQSEQLTHRSTLPRGSSLPGVEPRA